MKRILVFWILAAASPMEAQPRNSAVSQPGAGSSTTVANGVLRIDKFRSGPILVTPMKNAIRSNPVVTRSAAAALAVLFAGASMSLANVKPGPLFTDGAVLQQGMNTPVWGTAHPGEKVTVSIDGKQASATADATGHWIVRLPELTAGGPFHSSPFRTDSDSPLSQPKR